MVSHAFDVHELRPHFNNHTNYSNVNWNNDDVENDNDNNSDNGY